MRICSKNTLKKDIKVMDAPWEAQWNSSELAVLNDSKDLKLSEVCLLIPTKTRKEIYWKLYSEDIAVKVYNWLLKKKVTLFRPSKLCAGSVAGLHYKAEAIEILKILMKDGRVIISEDTGEYVVLANMSPSFIKKYNEKNKLLKREKSKRGVKEFISGLFNYIFSNGLEG